MMKSLGRTSRRVRRTTNGEIEREVEHRVDVLDAARAHLLPGNVVVERKIRRPRIALAQIRDQGPAVSTSPTDTA